MKNKNLKLIMKCQINDEPAHLIFKDGDTLVSVDSKNNIKIIAGTRKNITDANKKIIEETIQKEGII